MEAHSIIPLKMSSLFHNLKFHELNLKNNFNLLEFSEDKILKFILDVKFEPKENILSKSKLRHYDYFKSISIDEIDLLRKLIFQRDLTTIQWCEKILRFLEFRLRSLNNLFKTKFQNINDRMVFTQKIISLLLEYSFLNKDPRFFNIALKMLNIRSLNFFNKNKIAETHNSYNILLSHFLINNFNDVF